MFSVPLRHTGKVVKDVINMGSYNYLGFAENSGACADAAIESTQKYGVGVSSTRCEMGTGEQKCILNVRCVFLKASMICIHVSALLFSSGVHDQMDFN